MFQIPSDSQFNGMVHRYRIEFGAKLSFEFYKKCQNQNVKPSTALLTSILITIAKKYGMNSGILRTIFHCRSMSPDLSQKQEKCDLTNLAGWIAQPSFELFKIDLKENLSENQKSVQAVFDNVPTGGIGRVWSVVCVCVCVFGLLIRGYYNNYFISKTRPHTEDSFKNCNKQNFDFSIVSTTDNHTKVVLMQMNLFLSLLVI